LAEEKDKNNLYLISIIAIVAIVGLFFFSTNGRNSASVADDNLVGQAYVASLEPKCIKWENECELGDGISCSKLDRWCVDVPTREEVNQMIDNKFNAFNTFDMFNSRCESVESNTGGTLDCNEICGGDICIDEDVAIYDTTINKWVFDTGAECNMAYTINNEPVRDGLKLQCTCCDPRPSGT